MKKVYAITNFKGYYPVGTSAIVVAENECEACMLINTGLALYGLLQPRLIVPTDLIEVDVTTSQFLILNDGNY